MVGGCAFGVQQACEGVKLRGGGCRTGQTWAAVCDRSLQSISPCGLPDPKREPADWVSAGGQAGQAWGGRGANLVASASNHHVSSLRMFKNKRQTVFSHVTALHTSLQLTNDNYDSQTTNRDGLAIIISFSRRCMNPVFLIAIDSRLSHAELN